MAFVVEALESEFDGAKVLAGISFSIQPEEFVCITGPSGCGKTTLLKILAGLIPFSAGRVVQEGTCLQSSSDVGFVFQEGALFPWLTVEKNVAFGLEIKGVPKAARNDEIKRVLNLVGLADFAGLYPRQLSGGMKLRVALARALVYQPRILLMDEPFAALDFRTRHKMQKELLDVWTREKPTILMVTHNIDEAVCLGTRVIVLSERPARIKADLDIGLPRPRSRTGEEFNRIRRGILELVGESNC